MTSSKSFLVKAGLMTLVCGCAVVPDIQRRVESDVRKAADGAAVDAGAAGLPSWPAEQPEPEDLLCGVIQSDHKYRMALDDMKLADVQREDATWMPWPRLVTEGWLEAPTGDGNSDTHFSGGLYLRFDLIRAILYKNAVTIAEVLQTVTRQCRLDAASAAASTFLNRVVEMDAVLQAQAYHQRARALVDLANADGEALFKAGRLTPDRWYAWKRRRVENDVSAEQLVARLQKARLEVAQSYRGTRAEKDVLAYVARITDGLAADAGGGTRVATSDVLLKAPGVTKAKLDLFQAEVSILEARLKRLPRVWFDIGGGNIPVRGNDGEDYSGLVPLAGASMTLYDFGEISRGVERAELQTKQAREQLLQAVEAARVQLELTSQKKRLALAALASAEKRCEAAQTTCAETRALMNTGKMSIMDVHETEWMRIEADAICDRCRNEYRQALIAERAARSEVLDETMQKMAFFGCADKGVGETK